MLAMIKSHSINAACFQDAVDLHGFCEDFWLGFLKSVSYVYTNRIAIPSTHEKKNEKKTPSGIYHPIIGTVGLVSNQNGAFNMLAMKRSWVGWDGLTLCDGPSDPIV